VAFVPVVVERPGHTNEPVAAEAANTRGRSSGRKKRSPDTAACAEVGDTRVPGHANVYAGGRMEVDAGGQEVEW